VSFDGVYRNILDRQYNLPHASTDFATLKRVNAADGNVRDVSFIDRYWPLVLGGVALLVQGLSLRRALSASPPTTNIDAAFFEHAGWYVTQGAIPYADIWDIKPPLAIETTAVLAALAGGPLTLHLSSVALTAGAAIGCSLLIGTLAHRLTGDGYAALLAGCTLLAMPAFYRLSANGFRPKYLTLLFGLFALALASRERPLLAGAAAAASAGYWQYGAIFAVLVVGLAIQQRDRRALVHQFVGMALVTAVAVVPIVLSGALVPMFVEVVYVPLTTQAAQPIRQRLGKFLLYLAYALVPVGVGLYGLAVDRGRLRRHWWVYAGTAWGGVQLLFDLDSAPDLYLLVTFLAFGVALAVTRARPAHRRWLGMAFATIVLVNAVWVGGFMANPVSTAGDDGTAGTLRTVAESVDVSRPGEPRRYGITRVRGLYWNRRVPESCHYRLSGTERDWLAKTGRPYHESRCGSARGLS
jgi:hypothetical protein